MPLLLFTGGCAAGVDLRAPDPAVRIVAFGDSATRGPAGADYAELLPELLGLPADTVTIEGESGETTEAGLRRLGGLIERELFPNAETLIYWQGGADVVEFLEKRNPLLLFLVDDPDPQFRADFEAELSRVAENLTAAVARGRAAGWTVYLVTYYPIAAGLPCPLLPLIQFSAEHAAIVNGYLDELNAQIRAVAADTGATLVDVAGLAETLLGDPRNYFNCNHLTAAGNAQVAERVAAAIQTRGAGRFDPPA